MLRPERMSKVSVTGSQAVMPEVIETVHEFNRVHLSDYDGSWEGFDNGDPIEGAEEASEKLVTVRALEDTLDVDEEDAGRIENPGDDALEERLEELRQRVNELDDRREELRAELREVEERIEPLAPFATLGIDLDLLSGYDSIEVAVGEGDPRALREALEAADEVRAFEVFPEDGVVALAVAPAGDLAPEEALSEALVGVEFTRHEVPEAEGSPEEYLEDLRHEKRKLESEIESVENELEDVKLDAAGFLLGAERRLSTEVERAEAPLRFATTERSFVAEGWIPTTEYDELVDRLRGAVGDRVEIEELERADYDRHGAPHTDRGEDHAEEEPPAGEEPSPEAVDDDGRAVADGGTVTMNDEPPVVQSNPSIAKPFEMLVQAVSRPQYSEFDPTIVLFLTFPAFFGFMIADVGYGILYFLIGYFLYSRYQAASYRSLGGVAMWAGGFTMLFGLLFGEFFGLHELGYVVWGDIVPFTDSAPLGEKGLSPAASDYALAWIVLAMIIGVVHIAIGLVFDFAKNLQHDLGHAVYGSGSWLLMLVGLWSWIFSGHMQADKPDFIFTVFDGEPFALGFSGLPETAGIAGLVAFLVGLVLLAYGDTVEVAEFLQVLVHVLSYARITAVLLAKAGMALAVNLMVFGLYQHEGEQHYMIDHGPEWVTAEYGSEAIVFEGLFNMGVAGILFGVVVLVVGHLIVLGLGVTSAGIQAIRLEYVEFFQKFYEGGGKKYEPFGRDRNDTTTDT